MNELTFTFPHHCIQRISFKEVCGKYEDWLGIGTTSWPTGCFCVSLIYCVVSKLIKKGEIEFKADFRT